MSIGNGIYIENRLVPIDEINIYSVVDFPAPINTTDLAVTFNSITNEVEHAHGAGVFFDGQAVEFVGTDLFTRGVYFLYANDADSFRVSSTFPSFATTPVTFDHDSSGSVRVAGDIQLEGVEFAGKDYVINNFIFTPYDFVLDSVSARMSAVANGGLFYLGSGTLFKGEPFLFCLMNMFIFGTSVATLFDVTKLAGADSALISIDAVSVSYVEGFGDLGTLEVPIFLCEKTQFSGCGQGFKFNNNLQFSFTTCRFDLWTGAVGAEFIKATGTIPTISVFNCAFFPETNGVIFNLDKDLDVLNMIAYQSQLNTSFGGSVFATESLTQTDPRISFQNTPNVPNSTATAKLSITANPLTTTISVVNTPTQINTLWGDASIEERFVFQDVCTFNNITDVITTIFNHGLTDGDIIEFYTITGTLPTGLDNTTKYYVVNATATTFQVETTIGGGAVDFTTDGVGTNYYDHTTGAGNVDTTVRYIGLEDILVKVTGWARLGNTTAAGVDSHIVLMKVDTNGSISLHEDGAFVNVSNSWSYSSQLDSIMDITTNQGIKIYLENNTNTDNINVTDARFSLIKA